MKNTHHNTSTTEMLVQIPNTPKSTHEPDDLCIAINLSLRFLH